MSLLWSMRRMVLSSASRVPARKPRAIVQCQLIVIFTPFSQSGADDPYIPLARAIMSPPLPPSSPSSIWSSSPACALLIHGCTEAAQLPTTALFALELLISTQKSAICLLVMRFTNITNLRRPSLRVRAGGVPRLRAHTAAPNP